MNVIIEEISWSERHMKFTFPGDQVGSEVDQITKKMTKTVSLPGFRKGKVPFSVVKKRFGDEILNDAILELVKEGLKSEFDERDIRPVNRPSIVDYKYDDETEDYEITVTYEVIPEFDNLTLSGETIVKPVLEFSEDDIDTVIEEWRSEHQKREEIDGPAEETDLVWAKIDACSDGKSKWGAPQNFDLDLADKENEPMIVKAACVGKYKGDKFTVDVDFAQFLSDSEESEEIKKNIGDLRNIEYQVEITKIERPIPGKWDDDFLKYLGVSGAEDENFRTQARLKIEEQCVKVREELLREQAALLLLQRNEFMPPHSLVFPSAISLMKQSGLQPKEISEEVEKGILHSRFYGLAYFKALYEWKIELIVNQIELDRDLEDVISSVEFNLDDMELPPGVDADSESFQQYTNYVKTEIHENFRRNMILNSVLQDINLTETTMGLMEFTNWREETRNLLQQGPVKSLVDGILVPDNAEQSTQDDSVSLIVDSTGTPIDKSKSD